MCDYSRPEARDRLGHDYDAAGRLSAEDLLALGVPAAADFRLCGPSRFVSELTAGLVAGGVEGRRIHSECFGGAPAATGSSSTRAPVVAGDGPVVAFSRSGVTTSWSASDVSLLELAEANAVTVASGCRIGACHGCRATVLSGSVRHDPEPVQAPPAASALDGDVALDA